MASECGWYILKENRRQVAILIDLRSLTSGLEVVNAIVALHVLFLSILLSVFHGLLGDWIRFSVLTIVDGAGLFLLSSSCLLFFAAPDIWQVV